MKNVQIPEELFVHLVRYFMLDAHDSDTYNAIYKGIETKYKAIEKHSSYTTYKTAKTAEEREKARIEYLNEVGMRESFRQ